MSALWTAADARWRPAPSRLQANWAAGGVSIDTRAVARNDLFVALKGPRFDGHISSGQRWRTARRRQW